MATIPTTTSLVIVEFVAFEVQAEGEGQEDEDEGDEGVSVEEDKLVESTLFISLSGFKWMIRKVILLTFTD